MGKSTVNVFCNYVEKSQSHPAIIDPDEFNAVQAGIERRKRLGRPLSCESPLSAKLICGDCSGYFGPKVWGSNTKYRGAKLKPLPEFRESVPVCL